MKFLRFSPAFLLLTLALAITSNARAGTIPWVYTYNTAINSALAEHKQILLFAGRSTCGTCLAVKQKLAKEGPLAALTASYIPWYEEVDAPGEHQKYYSSKSDAHNLPFLFIIDPAQPYPERDWHQGYFTESGLENWLLEYAVTPQIEITGLTAAPGNRRVVLSWDAPDATVAGVVVLRGTGIDPTAEAVTLAYNATAGAFEMTVSPGYDENHFALLTPAPLASTATSLVDPPVSREDPAWLTNGQTYYYRVFAADSDHGLSPGVSVSTTPTFAEVAAEDLRVVPGEGFMRLEWTNPNATNLAGVIVFRHRDSDNILPVEEPDNVPENGTEPQTYLGARADNGEAVAVLTVDANGLQPGVAATWTDETVVNDTFYSYSIYPFSPEFDYGTSVAWVPEAEEERPSFKTRMVTGAEARPHSTSITLSWTNPVTDNLGGILVIGKKGSDIAFLPAPGQAYTTVMTPVDSNDGKPLTVILAENATTCTHDDLEFQQDYVYRIFAYDSDYRYSDPVEIGPVRTAFTCAAYGLNATSSGYLGIGLNWIIPTDTEAKGVVILRSTAGAPVFDFPPDTVATANTIGDALAGTNITVLDVRNSIAGRTYRDTGLTAGQTYWYGVYLYTVTDGKTYYCYSPEAGGSFASATPSNDLDHDGMDDAWEQENGVRDPNADDLEPGKPNRIVYLEQTQDYTLPEQYLILYQGWNMIAFPPTENTRGCTMTVGELLEQATIGPAWAWDGPNQAYVDKSNISIEEGRGYCVFAPKVTVVDLGPLLSPEEEAARDETTPCAFHQNFLPIYQGWNLVGVPDWAVGTTRDLTVNDIFGDAAQQNPIWRWNNAKQAYTDAGNETVSPTSAYWFRAAADGVLVDDSDQ